MLVLFFTVYNQQVLPSANIFHYFTCTINNPVTFIIFMNASSTHIMDQHHHCIMDDEVSLYIRYDFTIQC